MATPTIKLGISSTGVKKEIDDISRKLAKLAGQEKSLRAEFGKPLKLAGVRQAATSTQQLTTESGRLAQAQRATSREVQQAQRALLQLRSTLGGAERATSQMTVAEQRLQAARRAGLVSTQEATRLQGLMRTQFSTTMVTSRDLRTNMAGLNAGMDKLSKQGMAPLINATRVLVPGITGAGGAFINLLTLGLNPVTLGIGAAVAAISIFISAQRRMREETEMTLKSLEAQTQTLAEMNRAARVAAGTMTPGEREILNLIDRQVKRRQEIEDRLKILARQTPEAAAVLGSGSTEGVRDEIRALETERDVLDAQIQTTRSRLRSEEQRERERARRKPKKIEADPFSQVGIGIQQRAAEREAAREAARVGAANVAIEAQQREANRKIPAVGSFQDQGLLIFLEQSKAARLDDFNAAVAQADAARLLTEKLREQREAFGLSEREQFIAQQMKSIDLSAVEASSRDRIIRGIREEAEAVFVLRDAQKTAARVQQEFQSIATATFSSIIRDVHSFDDALANVALRIGDLVTEMLVIRPLVKGLFGSDGTGGLLGGAITGLLTGLAGAAGGASAGAGQNVRIFAAKGAVTRGLPSNTIIDKPTFFPTASGRVSRFAIGGILAGEAGTEAIMPLTRGRGGKLGVQSSGSGVQVLNQINIINNVPGVEVTTRTRERGPGKQEIDIMIDQRVAGIINSGGKTSNAIAQKFGLSRVPTGR